MSGLAAICAPATGKPHCRVPPGACDVHSHVFGPFDRYAPLLPSAYVLPDAGPAAHQAMRDALGITRGVIVQPAPYGTDPAALINAIAGSSGALKGVAVADSEVGAGTLAGWAEAGIVGLRFTEARTPGGDRYAGSVGFDALPALAPIMRELGLHAQLWAPPQVLLDHLPALLRLKVPLVIDHMAMLNPAADQSKDWLAGLLPMIEGEDLWLKLVLCRVGRPDLSAHAALREMHDTLLDARPDRMLWGSDWPYVRLDPAPDAAAMLDLFANWAGDEGLIRKVLTENPARLFQF